MVVAGSIHHGTPYQEYTIEDPEQNLTTSLGIFRTQPSAQNPKA